jgi:1,4-dihydroxy-2-naphthoyl-CoA hydrolase
MAPPEPEIDVRTTQMAHEQMPFAKALGLEVLTASADEVRARAGWASERCTSGGMLHGGFLMALADSLGAVCTVLNLPADAAGTATIESKTNFFRAVREGHVWLTTVPVHAGRTTIVLQTDITDDVGRLVSRSTQTQAVIRTGD